LFHLLDYIYAHHPTVS